MAVEAEDIFLTTELSHSYRIERYIYYYKGWLASTDSFSFSLSEKRGDLLLNSRDDGFYSELDIIIRNYSQSKLGSYYAANSINQFIVATRVSFGDLLAFDNLMGKDFPRGYCMYNFMLRYTPTFRFNKMTIMVGGGIAVTDIYGEILKLPSYLLDIKNTEENNKFFFKTALLEGTDVIIAEKIEGAFWGVRMTSPTDMATLLLYSGFSKYLDIFMYFENERFQVSLGGNVFTWNFSDRIDSMFICSNSRYLIKENFCANVAISVEVDNNSILFAEAGAALSYKFTVSPAK